MPPLDAITISCRSAALRSLIARPNKRSLSPLAPYPGWALAGCGLQYSIATSPGIWNLFNNFRTVSWTPPSSKPNLFWNRWSEQILAPTLPQWVYWQVFIAALCLVYAVFLIQIADWSALKSVSIVMLVVAMGYGLVTASLVLGGVQSPAARCLSLDGQTLDRGKIWCATMLCIATLISYFGGRESSKWKRANFLLDKTNADTRLEKTAI